MEVVPVRFWNPCRGCACIPQDLRKFPAADGVLTTSDERSYVFLTITGQRKWLEAT